MSWKTAFGVNNAFSTISKITTTSFQDKHWLTQAHPYWHTHAHAHAHTHMHTNAHKCTQTHTNAQAYPVSFLSDFLIVPSCMSPGVLTESVTRPLEPIIQKNGLQTHRPGGGITEIFILFKSLGRRERALALNPLVRREEWKPPV